MRSPGEGISQDTEAKSSGWIWWQLTNFVGPAKGEREREREKKHYTVYQDSGSSPEQSVENNN